jgi:hypothetical protein
MTDPIFARASRNALTFSESRGLYQLKNRVGNLARTDHLATPKIPACMIEPHLIEKWSTRLSGRVPKAGWSSDSVTKTMRPTKQQITPECTVLLSSILAELLHEDYTTKYSRYLAQSSP